MKVNQQVKVVNMKHLMFGAKGKVIKIWRKDAEMIATVAFGNFKAVFFVKDLLVLNVQKKPTLQQQNRQMN